METLKSFYTSVKPWGFWEPVREEVMKEDPGFEKNRNFLRDMKNVFMGIIWQTALVAIPIFIVVKKNGSGSDQFCHFSGHIHLSEDILVQQVTC